MKWLKVRIQNVMLLLYNVWMIDIKANFSDDAVKVDEEL